MRTRDLLSRFRSLSARERAFVLQASLLLPWTALALRTMGTGRLLRVAQHPSLLARPRRAHLSVERCGQLLDSAARHGVLRRHCLREAIVLVALLRRRGVEALVRIGVRKERDEGFEAHAWVEVDGVPVTGDLEAVRGDYREFPQPLLPQAPASR